ncbi:MAG: TetR/AcrR family transcriptional regulator [Brachybacterium sp.]|nr:TetR/AcrR family transcriptional regulator [Brachybacterium sp.]
MEQNRTAGAVRVEDLTPGARRILEVASELFYRQGIHGVGVDAIAAASGITKRTLYDRFGSKDALVATYLQARHDAWWDGLERRLAERPDAPVLALVEAYEVGGASPQRGCPFLNAAAELPADHPGVAILRTHKRLIRERLVELVRSEPAVTAAPEDLAEEIFLLLEGGIAHRGVEGDGRSQAAARRLITRRIGRADDATSASPA